MAVAIICPTCNLVFSVKPSHVATRKYCSHACKSAARRKPRWTRPDGYVCVDSPTHPHRTSKNYVVEHRLVMEQQLGRFLLPTEEVHHINGVKNDNRPENLRLFATHSEHLREHHEVEHLYYNPLNTATRRQCSKCRAMKPLTREFFPQDKHAKYGFDYRCRDCSKARWARHG